MRKPQYLLSLMIAAALTAAGADDTTARLGKATAVLNKMTQSGHDIPAGELASADCIVVIPGFKKGAIVVGVAMDGDSLRAGMVATGRHQARLLWTAVAWAYSSVAKK